MSDWTRVSGSDPDLQVEVWCSYLFVPTQDSPFPMMPSGHRPGPGFHTRPMRRGVKCPDTFTDGWCWWWRSRSPTERGQEQQIYRSRLSRLRGVSLKSQDEIQIPEVWSFVFLLMKIYRKTTRVPFLPSNQTVSLTSAGWRRKPEEEKINKLN